MIILIKENRIAADPAGRIGDTPDHDCRDICAVLLRRDNRIHDIAVTLCKLKLRRTGIALIVDIKLGNMDFQPEIAVLFQRFRIAFLCRRAHLEMRLHADAVNQLIFLKAFDHLDDRVALCRRILIEIIVEELCAGRCIFSCILECIRDIIFTDRLDPRRICLIFLCRSGLPVGTVIEERFIDNIPAVEIDIRIIRFDLRENSLDVIFHTLEHCLTRSPFAACLIALAEEPVRCLAVPYKRMAANREFQRFCIFQQLICTLQIDHNIGLAAGCLHFLLIQKRFRLQLIAERQGIEVLLDDILCSLRCDLGIRCSASELEQILVAVLEIRNIGFNFRLCKRLAFHIVNIEIHAQILIGRIARPLRLHIECDIRRAFRNRIPRGNLHPLASCSHFIRKIHILHRAAEIVHQIALEGCRIRPVLAVIRNPAGEGIVAALLAIERAVYRRAHPELGTVIGIQRILTAVCHFIGDLDIAGSAVPVGNLSVIEIIGEAFRIGALMLFAGRCAVVNIIRKIGIAALCIQRNTRDTLRECDIGFQLAPFALCRINLSDAAVTGFTVLHIFISELEGLRRAGRLIIVIKPKRTGITFAGIEIADLAAFCTLPVLLTVRDKHTGCSAVRLFG